MSATLTVLPLSVAAAAFAAAVFRPLRAFQAIALILSRAMYRVRLKGFEHLPDQGAALLVANHISYTDALLLGAFAPRPMRFVMDHRMFRSPLLGPFFRFVRAIPIAPAREDRACLEAAYEAIDEALANGELVCVFPEGRLTRDGEMDAFRPGVLRILERRPVPIYAAGLAGLWGSSFSYAHGRPGEKLFLRFRAPVAIHVGRVRGRGLEEMETKVTELIKQARCDAGASEHRPHAT